MYKITRVQSRPSTTVEFWDDDHPLVSEEFKTYKQTTYVDTGKLINKTSELSDDGLLITIVGNWQNQEAFESYYNDPRFNNEFEIPAQQYMQENGIFLVSRTIETI